MFGKLLIAAALAAALSPSALAQARFTATVSGKGGEKLKLACSKRDHLALTGDLVSPFVDNKIAKSLN